MSIADLRREYTRDGLTEADVDADPIVQFETWFAQALECEALEPNAMTLATVDERGRPHARIVLLKGVGADGFRFFTNYESAKARELATVSVAAIVFFWPELERQVRIEGTVKKVSREDSAAYFHSRPRESRIGAWASQQSQVVKGREQLEQQYARREAEFEGGDVPLPDFWGGYVLSPGMIEFWQGRPSRMHDRLRYVRNDKGRWTMVRLSP